MDLSDTIWTLQELNEEMAMENERADRRQAEEAERTRERISAIHFFKTAMEAIDHKVDVVDFARAVKQEDRAAVGALIIAAVQSWMEEE